MSEERSVPSDTADGAAQKRPRAARTPHPVDTYVGNRVQARRKQVGMSQDGLATALGLTFQQVQKYERGKNRISASRLQQIAGILQVPVSYFFEDEGQRPQFQSANSSAPCELDEFLASRDGTELANAFSRISDGGLRRSIIAFVEDVAGQDERIDDDHDHRTDVAPGGTRADG